MKTLDELKQELDTFLSDNPKAREFQDEIDSLMIRATCTHDRLTIIRELLLDNLDELKAAMLKLQNELKEFQDGLSKRTKVD